MAYKQLVAARFENNLQKTVKKRLTNLFHPWDLDFHNSIDLKLCFGKLKEIRASDAIKVFKGWTNAWATSSRYHEDKLLPCLLGCQNCTDSLEHYLGCPHLYAITRLVFG